MNATPEGAPRREVDDSKKYALLSVSNKTGIADLARSLTDLGYTVISTGGTGGALRSEAIPFVPIEDITGNPESFDGRMKTISFQAEGGILFDRTNAQHVEEARQLGVPRIDIVICNLYPFAKTIAQPDVTMSQAVESIDVGGPTMVRAAAKNFKNVLVAVDPNDYDRIVEVLRGGYDTDEFRQKLSAKAFGHLAFYDAQIAQYLNKEKFPQELTIPLFLDHALRYGDNPDQQSVFYRWAGQDTPMQHLERLAGREVSQTNVTDIQAGIMSGRLFSEAEGAVVVIKHNSPCGIAVGENAMRNALLADPESAFGGVVVVNRPMTMEDVRAIADFKGEGKGQMDIIVAPSFQPGVVDALTIIRKTTGVYSCGFMPLESPNGLLYRWVDGGMLVQTENDPDKSFINWRVKSGRQMSDMQQYLARIGWEFASRIKSNTVLVMDKDVPMPRGIGCGQTSRVRSARIALEQAGKYAKGATLISDGFIPMPDTVELAHQYGIRVIVQPGGSVRDDDVIAAAKKARITMVHTGQRTFWHQ